MNAVNLCRLALAGCFFLGAAGLAQAQELTAKQLEAKQKLERIFSCVDFFNYTEKETRKLITTYGGKKKKFPGWAGIWFVLDKPLELFSGKARVEVSRIKVDTDPEGRPIFNSFVPKLTLEQRQAINKEFKKSAYPDKTDLYAFEADDDENAPAPIDVGLVCAFGM
jgi:hypothetical protein